jgi:uncharacterized membrane protein YgcG
MRNFDFSSWQSIATTLVGIALFALIGVGIRLVVMMTIQQRRERMNRQINERLRTLIGAYKTLGGSFTGDLTVDPFHLRDLRRRRSEAAPAEPAPPPIDLEAAEDDEGSDRPRRIRDAVEAALSDIILLGTEDQVRLAADAARDLAGGRPVHVHALVVSLRAFIREALDLDPVPDDVELPPQGPARPSSCGGRSGGGREGGGRGGGGGGGGAGTGMAAGGMGMGVGVGLGAGGSDEGRR